MFKSYSSVEGLFNIISQYRSSNDPNCGMIDFLYYKVLGIQPFNDDELLQNTKDKKYIEQVQFDFVKYDTFVEHDVNKLKEIENFISYARINAVKEGVLKKLNRYNYKKISNIYDSKYIIKKIFNFYKKESRLKTLNIIIGEQGSGKSTTEKQLKYMMEKIQLTTNRPIREGEVSGVDHIFKEQKAVDKILADKSYILAESFDTKELHGFDNHYIIETEEFKKLKTKDCVVCLTPTWYLELVEKIEKKEIGFDFAVNVYYLKTKLDKRMEKVLERNSKDESDRSKLIKAFESRHKNELKVFKLLKNRKEIIHLENDFTTECLEKNVKTILERNYDIFNFKKEY